LETVLGGKILSWLGRTPVQTFVLSPLAVIGFELALHGGAVSFVPWGLPLLAWGYLQYRLVGRYRLRLGGGGPDGAPPQRIVAEGPYRCRNPMYLGHPIHARARADVLVLASLQPRAPPVQHRVRATRRGWRRRSGRIRAYRARVKRWVPGVI
jgi:protein-S-isoprenylcysteine O-methyltransferase Ste14